jgi:hypothetical protein
MAGTLSTGPGDVKSTEKQEKRNLTWTFTSEVQNQTLLPRHIRRRKSHYDKASIRKKYKERVHRNNRNWEIIERYLENAGSFYSRKCYGWSNTSLSTPDECKGLTLGFCCWPPPSHYVLWTSGMWSQTGKAVHHFNKSFSVFLGKADTLAYFVKMINFLHKYFRKRNINWSIWKIFLHKAAIFMLYKYHWKERFLLKVDNFQRLWVKACFTFENVTMELTIKNLTVIWDVSLQIVWRICKVEVNYGESSSWVGKKKKKKTWSLEGRK